MQPVTISMYKSAVIKGLAISAVVLLHILAYLPGIYHAEYQLFYITLDQLSRFCVPVFLMLSGYGLATQYEHKKIRYAEFVKKRVIKLLPLYLLWSVASILIISSVPGWSFGNQPEQIPVQLLLGQADYHLYFLPVLFQLYLLFPLLFTLQKKPKLLLFLALTIQAILYLWYATNTTDSDRFEYVLSLSWIGYFAFGIYLKLSALPKATIKLAPPVALLFLSIIAVSTMEQINAGLDPLPALKFTKLIIIPFALAFSLTLFTMQPATQSFQTRLLSPCVKLLGWLGKNSYLIFLSHTIGLRIIYALLYGQINPILLGGVLLSWIATIVVSQKILSHKR